MYTATSMPEGWNIIQLNGGIHSFIWRTKLLLYDIREPRFKQIKMVSTLKQLNLV